MARGGKTRARHHGDTPAVSADIQSVFAGATRPAERSSPWTRRHKETRMGPLAGIKIVELAGIGPGRMAAMLLADLGATVLRIDRTEPADLGVRRPQKFNLLMRNRECIALDLKQPEAVQQVLQFVDSADGLIEGFRPGVTERLGLGPDT